MPIREAILPKQFHATSPIGYLEGNSIDSKVLTLGKTFHNIRNDEDFVVKP
jgi:hypothetical protein